MCFQLLNWEKAENRILATQTQLRLRNGERKSSSVLTDCDLQDCNCIHLQYSSGLSGERTTCQVSRTRRSSIAAVLRPSDASQQLVSSVVYRSRCIRLDRPSHETTGESGDRKSGSIHSGPPRARGSGVRCRRNLNHNVYSSRLITI